MAQSESIGVPIQLTAIAVGDGGGNPVSPSLLQTSLVREMYRTSVNRVFNDSENPSKFTAEIVIPADVGGFVLREIAVYDETGGMFVVGNLPDTYKPNTAEGSYSDTVVRVEFMVTNADVVTLQIDPAVAIASQAWVLNIVTPCLLFPGGTTGQVLRKQSNDCGDADWGDPADVNVSVDTIEERQTLAAAQQTVTMSVVTTRGLAVYINGSRIARGSGADEWSIADDGVSLTQIVLGQAYPSGTRILLVQNEPAGNAPDPLERSLNLSDVLDKQQARNNLDIYSREEARQMAPAGMVAHFARSTAPSGWLKANGAAVSRTAYADLFAAVGTRFGPGDGFNTFNLPDLRGEFIRGWDDGRGTDPGRALGSRQDDEIRAHKHRLAVAEVFSVSGGTYSSARARNFNDLPGQYSGSDFVENTGGTETRPRNIAMLPCIKY